MKIYVDLDGVLADFAGQSAKAHGKEGEVPNVWDFYLEWGTSKKEFWEVIDEDPDFWKNLPELPWHDELVSLVSSVDENFTLLTSPHNSNSCYAGKRQWVEYHLSLDPSKRLCIYRNKHEVAKEDRLLIDDCEENVEKWSQYGPAILFPATWNSNRHLVGQEIKYVTARLKAMGWLK